MHSSPWIIDGNLVVGFDGNGTLEITTGGIVSNNVGYIGRVAGSNGLVTVSGAGSQWNNASSLYVGDNGKGTLNITAGGFVSNAESAIIGIYAGRTGVVTVSGAGSQWYVATASTEARRYGFVVGHYGNGMLEISDGGLVSNAVGYVGHNFGSTGKVTVSGAGSQWSNSFELYVGIIGSGTLNITDGGAMSSAGASSLAAIELVSNSMPPSERA
jgi:T5SS/PEP-CTERM-associated repeat protein